jgi:hypothetical protein
MSYEKIELVLIVSILVKFIVNKIDSKLDKIYLYIYKTVLDLAFSNAHSLKK